MTKPLTHVERRQLYRLLQREYGAAIVVYELNGSPTMSSAYRPNESLVILERLVERVKRSLGK